VAQDPRALGRPELDFLAQRHLATLTTLRPDGTPHVVAVGFTWDDDAGLVRVITTARRARWRTSGRARRGRSWRRWTAAGGSSLEGRADGQRRPGAGGRGRAPVRPRYRQPSENPRRVVLEIAVDRVLGRAEPTPSAPGGGVRPSHGVLSTTVVRVDTRPRRATSCSSCSSSAGPGHPHLEDVALGPRRRCGTPRSPRGAAAARGVVGAAGSIAWMEMNADSGSPP
jgi:hypothetical protein